MTYQANIPLATDLISVSQGDIKDNFIAIGAAWPANHIDFNLAGAGKHKFVEMPIQGSDPVTAIGEVTIYSKAVAGVATQFLRKENNGTVITTTGQDPIRAAAGSTFLPGDSTRALIFKWGDCGTVAPGGTVVTFASAFPNACYQVLVTVYQNGSNTTRLVTVDGNSLATLTGFTAYSSANVNARYMAIGS